VKVTVLRVTFIWISVNKEVKFTVLSPLSVVSSCGWSKPTDHIPGGWVVGAHSHLLFSACMLFCAAVVLLSSSLLWLRRIWQKMSHLPAKCWQQWLWAIDGKYKAVRGTKYVECTTRVKELTTIPITHWYLWLQIHRYTDHRILIWTHHREINGPPIMLYNYINHKSHVECV
jgi:hypothetical protein